MTDNTIMIDGVDVSGCNFTLERDGKIKCECCHATGFGVICDCESWKTCDYKNYKRKTQECEKWKNAYVVKEDALEEAEEYTEEIEEKYHDLQEQLDKFKAENEKFKNEYRIQLSKNLDKQIKINNLLNKLSLKEFTLKVNGKKYTKFNGIDKAKIFINDENERRNKKILELKNQMSDLQWKFYNNCKETKNLKLKLKQAEQKFEKIKEFATALCYTVMSDGVVTLQKDILQIIDEVE